MSKEVDSIDAAEVTTLAELLVDRVRRSPRAEAYRQFDPAKAEWQSWSWDRFAGEVGRWQQALLNEGFAQGDRVAVMLRNCREWAAFDMAAHALGLVVVPLYVNDRPDNVGLVLQDAGVRLLLIADQKQWQGLGPIEDVLEGLQRIVSLQQVRPMASGLVACAAQDWLPEREAELRVAPLSGERLATIVYTSGTTGHPKGVMLSHANILSNVFGINAAVRAYPDDVFLSFLPLSHMLERTAGYYLPMASGATVVYARSPRHLAEDLRSIQPTVLISVPSVFERLYCAIQAEIAKRPPAVQVLFRKALDMGWRKFLHEQGRAGWGPAVALWSGLRLGKYIEGPINSRMGGKLRVAIAGGAALSPEVARLFIALGLPILQGYGSTETSPVVCVNRLEDNLPDSVGAPLPGVELRLGEMDELQVRGPNVMLGYWNNPGATQKAFTGDGWLRTGDRARIESGHVYITGRIKEIIVLANGEKVPPGDMENAIALDPLFRQVMIIGEGRPYLAALVVINTTEYQLFAREAGLPETLTAEGRQDRRLERQLVARIAGRLHGFPGYAKVRRVAVMTSPWTVENGLLTPTLKLRRERILDACKQEVERIYAGH